MNWRGDTIVDLSREFLNTNGVTQVAKAYIEAPKWEGCYRKVAPAKLKDMPADEAFLENMSRLEVCSQIGLAERFDASIGAATVIMPFGGKNQLTPQEAMAAKIPLEKGETDDATAMSYGYIPGVSRWSPFHGSAYAVVESLSKLLAIGANPMTARLTFQEYFERLKDVPSRWGKPAAALLGAMQAQLKLGLPSIGGKDSMSGTFEDIDVPPTLVSFAVAMTKASKTISTEFKNAGSKVIFVPVPENKETLMPVWDKLIEMYNAVYALCEDGKVLSASVVKEGGTAASVCKACFGNGFGFKFANELTNDELFAPLSGSLVIELADGAELSNDVLHYDLGTVTNDAKITVNGKEIELSALLEKWTAPLERYSRQRLKCLKSKLMFRFTAREIHLHLQSKLQSLLYLSLYSRVQTVRLIRQEHLKKQVQMLKCLSSRTFLQTISRKQLTKWKTHCKVTDDYASGRFLRR